MVEKVVSRHPIDDWLRPARIPHIWCSGCGAGHVMHGYVEAMQKSDTPRVKQAIVSGIGCTGRIAG